MGGNDMNKLGLVGGMGPESTIPYYHDIVYGVQERVGKHYFPNLTIRPLAKLSKTVKVADASD